ncbi:outer membrane beta-barrel protein [Chitinophaga tropicalis]|nr:outer membrane beta-barrel protein [Chitinophaga tropicalis]
MKYFFFYLLILISYSSHAQITGKLITAGGQPLPFANVLLLRENDSSLVKGSLTDEQGNYLINGTVPGNYLLRISSVGYQTWESPVFTLTTTRNFGVLTLLENARQLGEVVVQAEKPLFQQRMDGLVVNVQSSVMAKGSSALQILERSPGVALDYQNGGLLLNGKSGVLIMLNGRLVRMPVEKVVSLLSSMSANDIEKVEILNTPGAGYDAEGAGIINIVMKKDKKPGTNGSFSLTAGYGKREKASGSLYLSSNGPRTNLYGSYTFSHDNTYSNMFITSSQDMPVLGGKMEATVWDTARRIQNDHNAVFGLDTRLNEKTSAGLNITYNNSNGRTRTHNLADYLVLPDSLLSYNGYVKGQNSWNSVVSSIYLEKKLRKEDKLNFDIDYLYFNNRTPSEVSNSFVNDEGHQAGGNNDTLFSPRQRGDANTIIQVGVLKMDYTKQWSKQVKMDAGIKGTYTNAVSESGIESLVDGKWIRRGETGNRIEMKEGIGAAYASFNIQPDSLTTLVAGARYEYSNTNMDSKIPVKRKLGTLFPSLFLSRKLSPDAELNLSYTKRISRPSYNDLASYVTYSDPTAVYTGNPFLRPTVTHNIKLGYNYRNYAFSLMWSRDKDPIARYQITQTAAADLLYISPQNLSYQRDITLQANLSFKISSWWDMSYSFTGSMRKSEIVHTLIPVENSYFFYSVNFNETFKLPRHYFIELSGWYNSRFYNGSIRIAGLGAVNAGIKKELNDNWGSVQLAVTDIFRTIRVNPSYGTLTKEAFDIKNQVHINVESAVRPIVKLTWSRSFGTGTFKTREQRSGAKDEKDRIRKE